MIDFIPDIWQWLAGFAGIVAAFFAIRQSGKKAERERRANERFDGIKQAQKIEKEVENADRKDIIDLNAKP